jgi:acetoin utilization deacetylase AcuC-like enzyme
MATVGVVKVVSSDRHRLHHPAWEVELGRRVPHRETAERADRILDALGADSRFVLTAPSEHGEAPVTEVHDPALVRFLADA